MNSWESLIAWKGKKRVITNAQSGDLHTTQNNDTEEEEEEFFSCDKYLEALV